MRFFWQSSSAKANKNSPSPRDAEAAKRLKKKFQPTLELLEKRELMASGIAVINVPSYDEADTAGNTGLPTLMSSGGGTFTYCGSLREAINLANQNQYTSYTINLASGGTYNITLPGTSDDLNAGGDFDIRSAEPVTIQTSGGGAAASIVGPTSGGGDRVFDIGPSSKVTFSDVTIKGGSTSGAGGGIRSAPGSIVVLKNSTVECDTASEGGGIAAGFTGMNLSGGTLSFTSGTLSLGTLSPGSGGSLSVSGGAVEDNKAYCAGGGIASVCETLIICNSNITGNSAGSWDSAGEGGGIFASGSIITLTDASVTCNTASASCFSGGQGGGIYADDLGKVLSGTSVSPVRSTLTISGGCINYNVALGGSAVSSDPFSGGGFGQGGGIYASANGCYSGGTQVTISCATIKGNTAQGGFSGGRGGEGGGAFFDNNLSVNVVNSTISGNTAGGSQGYFAECIGPSVVVANSGISGDTILPSGGHYVPGNGGFGGGIYSQGAIVLLTTDTVGGSCGNVAEAGYSNSSGGCGGGGGGEGGGIFAIGLGQVLSGGGTTALRSSLTISGGCITNNAADGGDWNPQRSEIYNSFNFPAGAGGGIFAQSYDGPYCGGTQLTITGVSILGNIAYGGSEGGAGGAGGGIFLNYGLSATITSSTIAGNTATGACGLDCDNGGGEGGGIYSQDDVLKLTSDTIGGASCGNVAEAGFFGDGGLGGGILAVDLGAPLSSTVNASLTVSGGCVTGNQARGWVGAGYGGGILATSANGFSGGSLGSVGFGNGYSGGTQVSITGTVITKNVASGGCFSGGAGGGILLAGPIQACITSATITCNTAWGASGPDGGGGLGGGIASIFAILKLTNTNVGVSGGGNLAGGDCACSGGGGEGAGIYAFGLGEAVSGESFTLTQSSLSISGGSVSYNTALGGESYGGTGGGIEATGTLSGGGTQVSITNVAIKNNCVTGATSGGCDNGGSGGGLYLEDVIAVISGTTSGGTTINGNTAGATGSGGGSGGDGGGIFMDRAIVQLTNVTVSGNVASGNFHNVSGGAGSGGGIFAEDLGYCAGEAGETSLFITNSTITCNSATNGCAGGAEGGGIYADGDPEDAGFILLNSSVTSNYVGSASGGTSSLCEAGAGIALVEVEATIFACLIANNKTDGSSNSTGAGISTGYCTFVCITNTTIAFNSAGYGKGGGLYTTALDSVNLLNDTIAHNTACSGGGVYRCGGSGGGQTSVLNTIIAENVSKPSGGTETDVFGSFCDEGYNLIGYNVGAAGSFVEATYAGANTSKIVVNANHDWVGGTTHGALTTTQVGLATALAINQLAAPFGVPYTLTLALEYTSLAVAGGLDNSTVLAGLTAPGGTNPQDQRGPTYIRLGEVDIGAYQRTPVNTVNTITRGGDDT